MPHLLKQIKSLGITSGWLDGEIVVIGDDGVPHFSALQNAFDRDSTADIRYFLFDLPFFEGYDLRKVPLRERRDFLEVLINNAKTDLVSVSADFEADSTNVVESACRLKLEGVIAKRADAPYESRRTTSWLNSTPTG